MTLRQPTFLSREEWKTIPWTGNSFDKNMLQHLLDDILDIPAFLEQFDKENCVATTEIISSNQSSSHSSLSAWAIALDNRLSLWKSKYADSYSIGQPTFASQTDNLPIFRCRNEDKSEIVTPTIIIYPDVMMATSLCMYNTARLLLSTTGLLPASPKQKVYNYACDICRSIPFYIRHSSRLIMMDVEFPLRVIYNTFDKASIESKFIEDICRVIRDRYHLEIFSGIIDWPSPSTSNE